MGSPTLKGLTIPDAIASIDSPAGDRLHQRREAVLFAHFGLTGPAILDVSRAASRFDGAGRPDLILDFTPDMSSEALDRQIQETSRVGRRPVLNLLSPSPLPRRLAESLMPTASVPIDRMGPELSREERRRLVSAIKSLRLPVTGTLGFAKAEVTSGGVMLDEVDPTTLESRKQNGTLLRRGSPRPRRPDRRL